MKYRFRRVLKKLLTESKSGDTLSKLPKGDNIKQIATTKVVKENGL